MPIFHHAQAWEEYGIAYAVHKKLWRNCVLATLGPQPDKGDKARDFSGRRNHGTLTGATHLPTWGNHSYRGQSFQAVAMDGTEDRIAIASASSLLFGSGSFSLSFWFIPTSGNVLRVIGSRITVGSVGWWVGQDNRYTTQNRVGFAAADGTNSYQSASDDQYIAGVWNHVAVSWNAATQLPIGWLNGKSSAMTKTGGTGTVGSTDAANATLIGAYADTISYPFAGAVADFRIYSGILNASVVSTLALGPLAAYEVRLPEYFYGFATTTTLTVAGSKIVVTSGTAALTQHNALTVGNAACVVTAGNVSLTQHQTLSVDGSAVATTSGAASLTQHNVLTVGGAACSVTSQSPDLTQHSALTVGNAVCAVSSGNVSLTQNGALSVQSAACSVTSENLAITAHAPAHVSLTVAGSKCVVTSGTVSLTQHSMLAVAVSACIVSSGNVTIAYHAAGAELIMEHQALLLAI